MEPELLDELAFDDPDAVRSRRELQVINALMGNFRWIRRELKERGVVRVVEIGASNGALLKMLRGEGREVVGVDLAPRPDDLPPEIGWVQGDAVEVLGATARSGTVVVSNHLLHQFRDEELSRLGEAVGECAGIVACEPLRAMRTRVLGVSLWPLFNHVTCSDMLVSIRAGFRRGELSALLGLAESEWDCGERCTWRGAYRLSAWRKGEAGG